MRAVPRGVCRAVPCVRASTHAGVVTGCMNGVGVRVYQFKAVRGSKKVSLQTLIKRLESGEEGEKGERSEFGGFALALATPFSWHA